MGLSPSVKLLHVVLLLFFSPCLTYTIYGTKRLSHNRVTKPSWNLPAPYQHMVRSERYPPTYEVYPSNQQYAEEYYYPQESGSYPIYYTPPRTSKYEVYQAVMPYYYGETPIVRPSNYDYYGYNRNGGDPLDNLEEEILEENERNEREEAQPIGQEVLYENENQSSNDNIDDVNAAFLQNLILSQMYRDSLHPSMTYYDPNNKNDELYPEETIGFNRYSQSEDEDVKELKQLANLQEKDMKINVKDNISPEERYNWLLHSESNSRNSRTIVKKGDNSNSINEQFKRNSVPRKQADFPENENLKMDKTSQLNPKTHPATLVSISTTQVPTTKKTDEGQKEQVLLRPVNPGSNWKDFLPQVQESNKPHSKKSPSVYDTIKYMLDMEKKLETEIPKDLKPKLRKRFVNYEDSLTKQLSVLKKTS